MNEAFKAGYDGLNNPYIWSSDNWLLHEAGKSFENRGYPLPNKAWKSRGYAVRAESNTSYYKIVFTGDKLEFVTVERT
jgi:hypothetical protein